MHNLKRAPGHKRKENNRTGQGGGGRWFAGAGRKNHFSSHIPLSSLCPHAKSSQTVRAARKCRSTGILLRAFHPGRAAEFSAHLGGAGFAELNAGARYSSRGLAQANVYHALVRPGAIPLSPILSKVELKKKNYTKF